MTSNNEKRKPITARELAQLLGVSQSAVSRAFTPGASISDKLRERILVSADSLGYSPNAIASILSKRKSNIVGIVISEMQNPFYPNFLEKLTRALQQQGQQSLLFNITPGSNIKQQLIALRQYNVDALIIISATVLSGADLDWATEGRIAVLVNRTAPDSDLTSVCCDNVAGARAIADHFYELGHRRVAYVGGLPGTTTNLDRQHGFIARVAELSMTLTACINSGSYTYDAGYQSAIQIARTTNTEAIFFANDVLAMGGIDALRDEVRIPVPEQMSVAGFDDIAMAHWPRYSLTTYRQPVDDIVWLSVQLVSERVEQPCGLTNVHLMPGELVVRSSTAPRATQARPLMRKKRSALIAK